MKLTVLANCQASPLGNLLNQTSSEIELLRIPPVHTVTKDNLDMVLNTVSQCDVVIHQPVGENFGPISSEQLQQHFPDKRFISFPSIFFAGLLPHLAYLRKPGGGTFQGPLGDYHDLRIVGAFQRGDSEQACLENIGNFDIDAQAHYQECWEESSRREQTVDIPVMHFVKERIKKTHIFYTFNHVDNELLWNVTQSVLDLLNVPRDGILKPPITKLLGNVIASVPASLTTALGCDWAAPNYFLQGQELPMPELISRSYAVYQDAENLPELIEFNRNRFSLAL